MEAIRDLLNKIYGPQKGHVAFDRLCAHLNTYQRPQRASGERYSQKDVMLITYADTLLNEGQAPLHALYDFSQVYFKDCFSAIHFLPFFPFSSDDGFAVKDFFSIDSSVGTWQDVTRFIEDFDLMFDYVLNHISSQSQWFANYLAGHPQFSDLAIEVTPDADLSQVIRPRALPLLTPFTCADGKRVHLWTTFSADQIDLNYKSIDLFLLMVDVLLFYVQKGARWLRMDAVAYLWKEIGTPCIHHPKTHDMVRLLRQILDHVAPQVLIVTETNVPHAENVGYFGNGFDEAQLVYNFTLPPLLLHTLAVGDAQVLTHWAQGLSTPSDKTTYFNFTASHDGIGVRPLEGILSDQEIDALVQRVEKNGGKVSYKKNSDGSKSPYELNITYVDALRRGDQWDVLRFLATQAIQMVLPGVPGIYIHSVLGSRNWSEGVRQTGRARTINRKKLKLKKVREQLDVHDSFRSQIFYPYSDMLRKRRAQAAFHPNAGFEVLSLGRCLFAIKRWCDDQVILALTNIGAAEVRVSLTSQGISGKLLDLLTNQRFNTDDLSLQPYQTLWLSQ